VPDTQNGARVGRHDQVDRVRPEIGGQQRGLDQFRVIHGQVDPAGPPVLMAVVLDRLPDRWRDDRQHLAQVAGQQPVKQDLVAVVQRGQGDVTGQVVGLAPVLRVNARDLVLQGKAGSRDQPGQAKVAALAVAERRSLVDPRIGKHLPVAQRCPPRAVLVRPHRPHAVPPASGRDP
jgi:hypothetical protein